MNTEDLKLVYEGHEEEIVDLRLDVNIKGKTRTISAVADTIAAFDVLKVVLPPKDTDQGESAYQEFLHAAEMLLVNGKEFYTVLHPPSKIPLLLWSKHRG